MSKVLLSIAFILQLIYSVPVLAKNQVEQDRRPDSIDQVIQNCKEEQKAGLLIQVAKQLSDSSPELGFRYATDAFIYAARFHNTTVKAEAYLLMGEYMALRRHYLPSLEFCLASVKLFRTLGDNDKLMDAYLAIGSIGFNINRDSTAARYFQKGLELSRKTGNFRMSGKFLLGIATVYQRAGLLDKANDYYHESLRYLTKIMTPSELFNVYGSIGGLLLDQGRYDEAIVFFKNLLDQHKAEKLFGIGTVYTRIAHAYSKKGQYRESLEWNKRALIDRSKKGSDEELNSSLINVAGDYFDLGDADSGWLYMQPGLRNALRYNRTNLLENAYSNLADFYTQQGEFEKALQNYRQYAIIQDAVTSAKIKTGFANIEDNQQIRSVNQLSQILLQKNEIQELNLYNQKFLLIFVETIAAISLILFFVFLLQFLRNRRAQQAVQRIHTDLSHKILERKKTQALMEERERIYRFISENSLDFITKMDHLRRLTYASPASKLVYGYEPEEIMNKTPYDFTHPDFHSYSEERIALMEQEKRPIRLEYKALKKDRTLFWAESLFNPVFNPETGRLKELVGVTRDISDRKRKEMEILDGIQQKENLLREIHHRVKNNFAILVSLINMQKDQSKDKAFTEALTNLQLRIRTMALVHEMLYRSVDFQQISFSEYIQSLSSVVAGAYRNTNARMEFELTEIPIHIESAIPLGLIVNEVLSNSFKHAFPNGSAPGKIHLILKKSEKDDKLELTIQDNGCGFREGFSWEQSSTMGLQIVQILVKQMEGSISITQSGGVQVKITFPARMLNN